MGKMFLETVRSEGLAHLSYIVGHNGKAAVIDPRRDSQEYVDIAYSKGAAITHIFETHRNEDYVIGSLDLARRTGAEIYHGKATDFEYGNPVSEGDRFEIGSLVFKILETPGHTFDSISIALSDTSFSEEPIGVFTGDALFIGDVGRTDFFPDRKEEVAGLLYESVFKKLIPLGDDVIIYPAHGAGSVCGAGMADREFSTLGYERKHNPLLQKKKKEDFILFKVNEHHYQPPYFKQMEIFNRKGAPELCELPRPRPMSPSEFEKKMNSGMLVIDTRSAEAFAGSFVPESLAIPLEMIPSFAGYFVNYDKGIGLITAGYEDVETAVRFLVRMGYDNVIGYLEEGLHAWQVSGRKYDRIPAVHATELVRRIQSDYNFTLLDVRKIDEYNEGRLPGAVHIYLGELPDRLSEITKEKPVTTFCGSGQRAIIAASILKQNGFEHVEDSLGSMAACQAIGCPILEH
ncbi:MAG: MBL fold metallo-hydrolase [Syntrophales bacterium]|jgi:hydroxyacylglutathione hydrolase|nr:MBL fold metallo-hydrolase [Syntrophales bacterium]MDY0045261.1 MBL fold metallo-hydrolase [Syntrophales bacterium]